jgi:uncharacterized protein (DUF2062 family)
VRRFLKSRVVDPLVRQLTLGVSPGSLALALALGATVGILPLLGIATPACVLIAAALRLNQPAIQVANYLVYPIQLALYVPFLRAGAWLFGQPAPAFTLAQVRAELSADLWGTVGHYAWANTRALGVWAVLAIPVVVVLHFSLRALLARLHIPGAGRAGGAR